MSLILNGKTIAGNGRDGVSAYQAAVAGGFKGTEEEFNEFLSSNGQTVVDALPTKANKSTEIAATLFASAWSDDTYILTVNGVTANSNQDILPSTSITAKQLNAAQLANIIDGGQSENTIIFKAFGEVPAIDIPIRVILKGDK